MAQGKGIPEGAHSVTPYLIVDDAAKAIAFYQRAFGAKEILRMPGPDGKSIMHAEIRIGDSNVYLTGENPEWGAKSPRAYGGCSCSLHLYVEDVDAAFKKATEAGATTKMPVTDMFWGDRYGKVEDPFGYEWGIATQTKELTPAQLDKAAQEYFAQMAAKK